MLRARGEPLLRGGVARAFRAHSSTDRVPVFGTGDPGSSPGGRISLAPCRSPLPSVVSRKSLVIGPRRFGPVARRASRGYLEVSEASATTPRAQSARRFPYEIIEEARPDPGRFRRRSSLTWLKPCAVVAPRNRLRLGPPNGKGFVTHYTSAGRPPAPFPAGAGSPPRAKTAR